MKNTSNLLVIDGGVVKSEENGIVKGLAIVFGSPQEPDQSEQRDFFTNDSFIMKKTSFDVPLYHNHGLPVKEQIGEATLTKTEIGWEATAKLDLTNDLAKKIYKSAQTKQYGFSTGALSHLVEREAKENNTNFLKRWVVGELSLTERPAERRAVVQAIKSLDGEVSYVDAFTEKEVVNVTLFDEEGNQIWDNSGDIKTLQTLENAKTIELKDINGSVTYSLSIVGDDADRGAIVSVYEWGGVDNFISHLQDVLSVAATAVGADTQEDATEVEPEEVALDALDISKNLDKRIEGVVKSLLEGDQNKVSELKSQLESANGKLADTEQKLSESETNLTEANEKIARLEVLAGAKQTIDNYKGK